MIESPRLLEWDNVNECFVEVRRLNPVSLSITENIVPLSTTSMTLPRDQAIPIRSWVEVFTANGSAGIYRTHAPSAIYGTDNDSYELDHGICELGDYIIKEEIEETPSTLPLALARMFESYGGDKWQLGTVCSGDVLISESYQNLLQYINDLIEQVDGAFMTFDFTTTPWTVNVEKVSSTVAAEGRLSRNVMSVVITRDDSELCTRVSMDSLGVDVVDADTISTWGVIERRLTGEMTKQEAVAYATAYLAKYKNPLYSISIDGFDFYSITGEPLDKIQLGKTYRIAIPEDNVIVECPVIEITWQDCVLTPYAVSLTLGNPESTITGNVFLRYTEQRRKNDKYESSIKYTNQELTTLFTKTGVNSLGANETLYSKIGQTAENILLEVADDYYGKKSNILITSDGITLNGKTLALNGASNISMSSGSVSIAATGNIALSGFVKAGDWGIGVENTYEGFFYRGIRADPGTGYQRLVHTTIQQEKTINNGDSLGFYAKSWNNTSETSGFYASGMRIIPETYNSGSAWGTALIVEMLGTSSRQIEEVRTKKIWVSGTQQHSTIQSKKNVKPLPDLGEAIDKLNPVSFEYKEFPGETRYGLIAEEAGKVMPVLCDVDKSAISYTDLIPVLLKEIQSLRKRVKQLEERMI